MDCSYKLIRGTYPDENGTHTGYGIAAINSNSVTISAAYDLSCDESEVTELVRRCNELKLSLVHFQDVVDDFLN